ncbi:MAG: zinc-ribbon domain-containing protein [Ktedonobacteraceae bacterium]
MQCRTCQYELPPTVTFCPNCGAPVASPVPPVPGSSPYQGIAPTVSATPSQPGIAPTVFASSPNQGMPASYPTYPPQPAAQPPYTPNYAESAPPPPAPQPYMPVSYGESAPPLPIAQPYGAAAPPYGVPPQAPYGAPPMYMPQPQLQQPKRNNGCVIALVIVLVLFVLGVGGVVASVSFFHNQANNAQATLNAAQGTLTSDLTPIATTGSGNSNVPDATQINSTAAANITGAQSAGAVDSNNQPTDTKSSFTTGDTVYITMTLAGNSGYATMKVYRDSQFDIQSNSPLTLNSGDTNGAFSITVNNPGQFVVGLYWCTRSDCSDAALAKVVNFDVS